MATGIKLVMALGAAIVEATKIKQRFNMEAIRKASCRVAVLTFGEEYDSIFTQILVEGGLDQCNITKSFKGVSGYKLANGSYSGLLGMTARKEVDFAIQQFRPAGIEDDIVGIGPVLLPTGLQATAQPEKGARSTNDVLNVLHDFRVTALAEIAALLYIAVTVVTFVTIYGKKHTLCFKPVTWTKQWLDKCWHFALTVVDQEILTPTIWAIRFVWLSCCVAIFLVVFGFLLGILSTDESVELPPKRIETIYDLLNERELKDRPLMLFKCMHFYNYLLTSDKGTDASKLYERLKASDKCEEGVNLEHCGFLETALHDPKNGIAHMSLLAQKARPGGGKGTRVLLIDQAVWHLVVRPALCIFVPGVWDNAHSSKDFVVSDYATAFYNKAADEHLVKRVMYRMTAATEAAGIAHQFGIVMDALASNVPTGDPLKRFRCMRAMTDEATYGEPVAFKMSKFKKTSAVVSVMIALACVALALELIAQYWEQMRMALQSMLSKIILRYRSLKRPSSRELFKNVGSRSSTQVTIVAHSSA